MSSRDYLSHIWRTNYGYIKKKIRKCHKLTPPSPPPRIIWTSLNLLKNHNQITNKFFPSCLWLVQHIITCSWLVHNLFRNCLFWLVYNIRLDWAWPSSATACFNFYLCNNPPISAILWFTVCLSTFPRCLYNYGDRDIPEAEDGTL